MHAHAPRTTHNTPRTTHTHNTQTPRTQHTNTHRHRRRDRHTPGPAPPPQQCPASRCGLRHTSKNDWSGHRSEEGVYENIARQMIGSEAWAAEVWTLGIETTLRVTPRNVKCRRLGFCGLGLMELEDVAWSVGVRVAPQTAGRGFPPHQAARAPRHGPCLPGPASRASLKF